MSNLTKLEFFALDISGKNYLRWTLDAEIHLDAKGLGGTICENNEATNQDRAKALIFIHHNLHESLKDEYLTIKDPLTLWKDLKERYEHQKLIVLPKARYDWMHLRLQDYKSVGEYNSILHKICSQLKHCGETITEDDILEKTFSTFHASNVLLQQQYSEKGFKRYSELLSCLLVAELNNGLLMKNHKSRPTSSTPFPEMYATTYDRGNGRGRRRGRGRGRFNGNGQGRGRGRNNVWHRERYSENQEKNPFKGKEKIPQVRTNKNSENLCFRCGMKGHWSYTCRTPKHFVELYKASLKEKEENKEINFVQQNDDCKDQSFDLTHLEVADFFARDDNAGPSGESGHV